MGMTRRLYINGVSLVSLPIMLGGGSVLLVATIRRMGIGHGHNTDLDIAISATLLFIGLPVWAIHHRLGQRTVRNNPDEAGSLFRAIYIYGALLISGLGATIEAIITFTSGQDQFAAVLVFGAFWTYFLFLEHGEARPTRRTVIARQLYFYTMSAALVSLAMAAFFLGIHLGLTPWKPAYEATGILDNAQHLFGAISPPGIAWATLWLLFARRNTRSTLYHIYVYFFGITFGVLIAAWGAADLIRLTLNHWLVRRSGTYPFNLELMPGIVEGDTLHGALNRFVSAATSPLVFLFFGLSLVAIHWLIVRNDKRSEVEAGAATVRDISRYALAALSLAALPFGIYLLLVDVKQELFDSKYTMMNTMGDVFFFVPRWTIERNITLLMAFALVGALLWLAVWPRIGLTYPTNGGVRFARIAYFGSVLIVSGSAACLSLVIVVGAAVAYLIFDRQPAPPSYLYGVPLAILAISALLFAYHLLILRRERHNSDFSIPPSDPLPPSPPMPGGSLHH